VSDIAKDPIPLASASEWERAFPRATLLPIAGAGHFPFVEQPHALLRAVQPFVAAHPPSLSPSGLVRQVLLRPIHDWSGLFVQMGRQNVPPDGTPFPMLIEPTPAAAGIGPSAATTATFGFVQSIIRPTLLVIRGPLFVWTGATPSAATSAPAGPPARARALRRRRRQRDHRGGGRHLARVLPDVARRVTF